MRYNNEDDFDREHAKHCDNNCWNTVSGQYDEDEYECPACGARYRPAQEWFNSEANPQYDESGLKVGSGEYQTVEFEGEIPEE